MSLKALDELTELLALETLDQRQDELDKWKTRWIETMSKSQLVLNPSTLSSMENDFLVEYLVRLCNDDILESSVAHIERDGNRYYCRVVGIRNKPLKE